METCGKPGPSRYNRGCRCAACRELNSLRHRSIRDSLKAKGAENPELIPHGTTGGYANWGCRCPLCQKANADHSAAWRENHP